MQSRKLWLGFCIVLSVILAACNQTSAATPVESAPPGTVTPPPTPELTATAVPVPVFDYSLEEAECPLTLPAGALEGKNISCGTMAVPELHAQPEGNSITLTIAIIKSVTQPPQAGPLFMLAGGPGSSALNTFIPLLFMPSGAGFRANRDVVLVEQRGTLYASPHLICDEIEAMNLQFMAENYTYEERASILAENLIACYQRFNAEGINLSAYNSVENAADIAAVARTLGYDQVNLYGGSYGTMLAQHLMREYPGTLRSVILDSVAPLRHEPNVLYKAVSLDRSLRLLFEKCAANPACNAAYPDLEPLFFETVSALNATPAVVPVTNPQTGEAYTLLLTGDKLVQLTRNYLYLTPILSSIPKLLTDIAGGDYEELSVLQSLLVFNQNIADAMYKSVICSEIVDFTAQDFVESAELYADVSRVMHEMLGEIWIDTCEIWHVEKLEPRVKTSVASDIPTLILSGEFDPTTPPSLAAIASEDMSQAYSVTFPGIAHGALGTSECATAIMLGFLENPTSEPDTGCVQYLESLAFALPEEQAATINLTSFTVDTKGIQGVAPEGWSEPQPGMFVRGHSALDQTLIIVDAVPGQEPSIFIPGLKTFLNLEEFPEESTGTLESGSFSWDIYLIESTINGISNHPAVALAQGEEGAYVIVMMASPEDAAQLYKSVFVPAVENLQPIN